MTGSVKKQIETEAKEGRKIKERWRREKKKTRNLPLSLFKKKERFLRLIRRARERKERVGMR
jgi:hypothetical protein